MTSNRVDNMVRITVRVQGSRMFHKVQKSDGWRSNGHVITT